VISECVRNFCDGKPFNLGSCSAEFMGTPAACCSNANPAACLADYQKQQGYDGADAVNACNDVRYAVKSCQFSNSNFSEGYNTQAQCLCYDSTGAYSPSSWQNEASSCYASGPKAHPTIYSLLAADNSAGLQLCTKFAGPSAVSTPATVTDSGLAALQFTVTASSTTLSGGTITSGGITTATGTSNPGSSSNASTTSTAKSGAGQVMVRTCMPFSRYGILDPELTTKHRPVILT